MRLKTRKARVRLVVRVVVGVVVFVLAWYGVGRATSPWRVVRVMDGGVGFEGASDTSLDADGLLRVVTYNIAHGRGTGDSNWTDSDTRGQRLRDIAGLLREMDADVVVLNEVDFCSVWSGHENQAALIAAEAGYRYRVELSNIDMSVPFASYRFGNVILSRHPIRGAEVIGLPGYSWWETLLGGKKRAVVCEIELAGGEFIQVVGVHFDTRGDEDIRVRSARAVIEAISGSDLPTVIAGDLNSTLTGLPRAQVDSQGWTGVDVFVEEGGFVGRVYGSEIAKTFPSWEPNRTIDWVLVGFEMDLIRVEVGDSDLSDHLPVVADVVR